MLEFECPRTEPVVSTRIKVDEVRYKAISHSTTYIHCPYCRCRTGLLMCGRGRDFRQSTSDEFQSEHGAVSL